MVSQKSNAPIIDENFISTDAGNGWAACYRLVNGRLKQHGIPHARARVTGARVTTDIGGQNVAEYADFMGQRYGYGDGIWNLTNAPIDTHQNTARRYGGHMHLFLMLVNIAEMGVKSGSELTAIVPAPPGLINQVSPQIKEAILAGESGAGDGVWTIQLRKDKRPRTYKFIRVIVMPEGAGAYAAYRFDLNGEVVELPDRSGQDMLAGRVVVLDLGAGTGDSYTVYDGNMNPDAIDHATDDKAGVIHNLLQPILGDIKRAVPDATHLTTAHVDSFLRKFMVEQTDEAAQIRVSGKAISLKGSMLANVERYAEWIAANKIDPIFAGGADAIVTAGGGWLYILRYITDWYPDRLILHPYIFAHVRKYELFDLNGVGQLAFAAAVMKAQQV